MTRHVSELDKHVRRLTGTHILSFYQLLLNWRSCAFVTEAVFTSLFFCIHFSQFCSVGMNAKFVSLFHYYLSVCFLSVSMGHVA